MPSQRLGKSALRRRNAHHRLTGRPGFRLSLPTGHLCIADRSNDIFDLCHLRVCPLLDERDIFVPNIVHFNTTVSLYEIRNLLASDIFRTIEDVSSTVVRARVVLGQQVRGESTSIPGVDYACRDISVDEEPQGALLPGLPILLDELHDMFH